MDKQELYDYLAANLGIKIEVKPGSAFGRLGGISSIKVELTLYSPATEKNEIISQDWADLPN